jgi:hypothetical protein
MLETTEYFEKPGKENTARCIETVEKLVREKGYRHVVVASTSGETGLAFARALQDSPAQVVVVTHNTGYKGPNVDECADARDELARLGARVYTGTILTRGIEAALMKKLQGVYPAYITALTLRLFGQGVKVGVEITAEACDGGLIPEGGDIIAVGGTARGSDVVMIVEAHPSDRFFDIKVKRIVARPNL